MKLDRAIRTLLGIVLLLAFVIALAAVIFVTESALNVWDRLVTGPRPVLYAYVALIAGLVLAAIWLTFNLLVRRSPKRRAKPASASPIDRNEIEKRLQDAEDAGLIFRNNGC